MKLLDEKGDTIAESRHVHVGWNPVEKIVKVALLVGDGDEATIPVTIVIPVDELDHLLPELAIASNELRHIQRLAKIELTIGGPEAFLNALASDLFRAAREGNLPGRREDDPGENEKAAGFGGGDYDGRHG